MLVSDEGALRIVCAMPIQPEVPWPLTWIFTALCLFQQQMKFRPLTQVNPPNIHMHEWANVHDVHAKNL